MSSQTITNEPIAKSRLPQNWEKSKDVYTGDDLIDAFLTGKEAGKNEHFRILLAQFKENIDQAASLSEKLYKQIAELNIKPFDVRIKAEDITRFKALFIVQKEDFLSDEFRNAYVLSRKIKNDSESDKFYISFSFTPSSEDLNEHCLVADGFFMKYDKK